MSLRQIKFQDIVKAPANLFRFKVVLPLLNGGELPVYSASTPKKSLVTKPITVNGIQVEVPVKTNVDQSWQCYIYEDNNFNLLGKSVNDWEDWIQNEFPVLVKKWGYISISLLSESLAFPIMGVVKLHYELSGAYLKSVNPVQLQWSDTQTVFAWNLEFGFVDFKIVKE